MEELIIYLAYIFLAGGFIFLVWTRLDDKRLRLKNGQLQKALNEKNAELLTRTFSVIQRNETLLRIREELNDFYKKQNNKSFAPLFDKINVLLDENMNTEDDWKSFLISFEQKHAGFFKEIKDAYPHLTANDLKLCACLKLNLDSKAIASLMNISLRAVENSRSRLRKKLNLAPQEHLADFFLKY